MIIWNLFVCCCLVASYTPGAVEASIYEPWDNDIYFGRHFDDYITQTEVASSEVITPAILVMYTPMCENILKTNDLNTARLPPGHFMVFGKHDYQSSSRYVWYNIDARDDLNVRYPPKSCPDYMFFAEGTRHDVDEPVRYNLEESNGKDVYHWIWDVAMKVKIKIVNNRENGVIVKFNGRGPRIASTYLSPSKEVEIESYTSYFITIHDLDTWTFLYGSELGSRCANDDILNIDINSDTIIADEENNAEEWLQSAVQDQNAKELRTRTILWQIANIYLLDLKQPVLLPKFTEDGYKIAKIPSDLYSDLIGFYRSNEKNRVIERSNTAAVINVDKKNCSIVKLPKSLIDQTALVMKPMMEDWAKVPLFSTALYGIREYYKGNILRNHVDRISTHIVSAILQIHKDLDDQPDWELETIGFDGVRRNITLQPGEMLFYESATLIHGRPFPFKGRIFANAFLHYKPLHGWTWDKSQDGHLRLNGVNVETIATLATTNTMKGISKDKFTSTLHGEL